MNLQCLKYKTQSSIMLNRFEAFNLSMMSKMQNRRPQPPPVSSASFSTPGTALQTKIGSLDAVMADATASQGAGVGTSSGVIPASAAKKKKPKKRK
jgi:signal recognition particle subunit SRP9